MFSPCKMAKIKNGEIKKMVRFNRKQWIRSNMHQYPVSIFVFQKNIKFFVLVLMGHLIPTNKKN